jgi:hypothetical protein
LFPKPYTICGLITSFLSQGGEGSFLVNGNCEVPILESVNVGLGAFIYKDYATGALTTIGGQLVGVCVADSEPVGASPTIVKMRFAPTEYGVNTTSPTATFTDESGASPSLNFNGFVSFFRVTGNVVNFVIKGQFPTNTDTNAVQIAGLPFQSQINIVTPNVQPPFTTISGSAEGSVIAKINTSTGNFGFVTASMPNTAVTNAQMSEYGFTISGSYFIG